MIRVVMIKNRESEFGAITRINEEDQFPDNLIPLVEVIHENEFCEKIADPETGEDIVVSKKSSKKAVKQCAMDFPNMACDTTLKQISDLFENHEVFVEFFRCNLKRYKRYDPIENQLVIELNSDLIKYKEKTLRIAQYHNLIPVIAIKNDIDKLTPKDLISLVEEIRTISSTKVIAVRIDEIDGYEDALTQSLTSRDYLLFDISEAPIDSKEMEYEELAKLNTEAQLVLLNSPRKRGTEIEDYEPDAGGYTSQIDSSGIDTYKNYGFTGYGDYGGLKDKLPARGFGRPDHPGRALALLYDGRKRAFKVYVNDDVTCGQAGYQQLFDSIFGDREDLDPDKTCIVYKELEDKISRGVTCLYREWVQYTLIRYIKQITVEQE